MNHIIIGDRRILINYQYSKIGNFYPRLFIERKNKEDSDINFDIFLKTSFRMKDGDFEEWLKDSILIESEEEITSIFKNIGIDYRLFKSIIEGE